MAERLLEALHRVLGDVFVECVSLAMPFRRNLPGLAQKYGAKGGDIYGWG